MANTITLKDGGGHLSIRKEAVASEAITPGHLVEFGGDHELQKHSTVDGTARRAFAVENDLVGRGIDDAYAAGETVQHLVYSPGCEVQAFLDYGQNVEKGAALTSAGNGTLKAAAGTAPHRIVAFALEPVNANTDGAARIAVEVA